VLLDQDEDGIALQGLVQNATNAIPAVAQ
jgi:hypothetical protein